MLEIENSQVFVLGGSGLIGGGIAEVVVYAAHVRPGKRLTTAWLARSSAGRSAAFTQIFSALATAPRLRAFLYTSAMAVIGDHGDAQVSETTSRVHTEAGDFHFESERMVLAAKTDCPARSSALDLSMVPRGRLQSISSSPPRVVSIPILAMVAISFLGCISKI